MQSFSQTAFEYDLQKPQIVDDKKLIQLEGVWHPLIKANIKDQFVAHDINLDHENFFGLITVPNMAGKTTVIRDGDLMIFLTQLGSFDTSKISHVSFCDYVFKRL